ncbi:hypothetical protein CspHIS471_0402160 [Cutaneotrichosporon sp. HIS471]|nr:hypothetical protein CspHIS471_0402160 [Cutaneotrichosporon sp. HIS471]
MSSAHVKTTVKAYDLAIAYQYFLSIYQNELGTAGSGDISAAIAHRILLRALSLHSPAAATFLNTVITVVMDEHALKAAFLRMTGQGTIQVINGALDLALPLLKEMATQGISYEELSNRQLAASTMADITGEGVSAINLDCSQLCFCPSHQSDAPLFVEEGKPGALALLELYAPFLPPSPAPQPPLIPVMCHPLQPFSPGPLVNFPTPPPTPFMTQFGPLPDNATAPIPAIDSAAERTAPGMSNILTFPPLQPMSPLYVASGSSPSGSASDGEETKTKHAVSTKAGPSCKTPLKRKSTASKRKRTPPSYPNVPKTPRPRASLKGIPENDIAEEGSSASSSDTNTPSSPPKTKKAGLSRCKSTTVVTRKQQVVDNPTTTSEPTRRSLRLNTVRF